MRESRKNRNRRYLGYVRKLAIDAIYGLFVGCAIYLGYWGTSFILIGLYMHKKVL